MPAMCVLPSNTCGTLDVHQTNMLVTCARFIITHVQYIGIGNAADSRHNTTYKYYSTMAPDSIIRQLTSQLIEPTDHVFLLYIKTTLTGNSFLNNGEDESRDEEEGANLTFRGYAIILTATQQCRIDVQHD